MVAVNGKGLVSYDETVKDPVNGHELSCYDEVVKMAKARWAGIVIV